MWRYSERAPDEFSIHKYTKSETQTRVQFSRQVLIFKTHCFTLRNSYLLRQPDFGATLCI